MTPFVSRRGVSFDSKSLKIHRVQGDDKIVFAWKKGKVGTKGIRKNGGARTGMKKAHMGAAICPRNAWMNEPMILSTLRRCFLDPGRSSWKALNEAK